MDFLNILEKRKMKLVVMIPAYNEEATICKVIESIPKQIEGIDKIEILVIDDGSKDKTAAIAKKAGAVVIGDGTHFGLGQTFKKGLNEALKRQADIIVNIDGDGQFFPQDIARIVRPILDNEADMATGSRFLYKPFSRNIPWIKRWGNRRFAGLISFLTKKRIADSSCGFRAYSRESALKLNLFGKFTYTQEVLIDLLTKGMRVKEIPIKCLYKKKRKSAISGSLFAYGVKAITIILRTFRDYKPLMFFGLIGFVIFCLGLIGALYSLIFWLATATTTPVRTLFNVSSIFLIFGFLLIFLALIADMLKRIRLNQGEILYQMKKGNFRKEMEKLKEETILSL